MAARHGNQEVAASEASAPAEPASAPVGDVNEVLPLPPGPEITEPYCYRQYSVDEQLDRAGTNLLNAKTEKVKPPGYKYPTPPDVIAALNARGSRARQKKMMQYVNSGAGPKEVKKVFLPDEDARFIEMQRYVKDEAESADRPNDESQRTRSTAGWRDDIGMALDSMLSQLKMTFDPVIGEPQLERTYQWYCKHKAGPNIRRGEGNGQPTSGGPAEGLNFLVPDLSSEKRRPGSAFYEPQKHDFDHHEEEAGTDKGAAAGEDAAVSRYTNVQLPPARERLRGFETKSLVSPLTARRLKAQNFDDCMSPEPFERPYTPSTATGGSQSARSYSSARSTPTPFLPLSARSSPTPMGGSRPSSAASSARRYDGRRPGSALPAPGQRGDSTVGTAASSRPGTASRLPRPPPLPPTAKDPREGAQMAGGLAASALEQERLRAALEKEAAEREMEEVLQRMEERWVMRRHREIANMTVDEERHAAVALWSERRARVEEEIALNAEAMRVQSELWRRGTTVPADAEQDIPPTSPEPDTSAVPRPLRTDAESAQRRGSIRRGSTQALPPGSGVNSPRAEEGKQPRPPSRHDVSTIGGEPQVRFAPEAFMRRRKGQDDDDDDDGGGRKGGPITDKIATLRRIHRNLLKASKVQDDEEEEDELDDEDEDGGPQSVFQTEIGAQFVSLSAYTADSNQAALALKNDDDADVVAAVCDHWSAPMAGAEGEGGSGLSMHELRFRQQQEAEAVKRRLTAKNCLFSAGVVDSGLVMPSHLINQETCVFNTEPNLKTTGLPTWFTQAPKKKKAAATKKKGKKGRRASAAPKKK